MLKLITLSILTTCTFAAAFPYLDSGRVVNGTDASEGEIPYIISLRSYSSHICGGSILDERHVLTAAHCVVNSQPNQLSIQYGVTEISPNENVIQVSKITVHENYDATKNYANDVAVLELAAPLPLGDLVQPVTLPEQDEAPPAEDVAVLAGWGYSQTGGTVMKHLQRVDLLVYSDENCSKAHGTRYSKIHHICSGVPEGGKGQCSGDSGGPLVANGKQIGSVSWSVKPCTIKGYPGVYSRTSSYVNWIIDKMQQQ